MTKSEIKIKFAILTDMSSNGVCTRSDQELALEADTTVPYVQVILRQMELSREINMASTQFGRQITYPSKKVNSLWWYIKREIMTTDKQYYEYEGRTYVLSGSFISPLGNLMIRFYDEEKRVWMNVSLGPFEDLLLMKQKTKSQL